MFEVGDRVVVVDDSPIEYMGRPYAIGITRGEVYTVLGVYVTEPNPYWAMTPGRVAIRIGMKTNIVVILCVFWGLITRPRAVFLTAFALPASASSATYPSPSAN